MDDDDDNDLKGMTFLPTFCLPLQVDIMQRLSSLEKTLMLGKAEGKKRR